MEKIKDNLALPAPRILYVTAGAGGMFCGSCLHDNALAGALRALGLDLVLLPAYTPIRTDSHDHSTHRVVFGGISLYLRHAFRPFRALPAAWTRWLDRPHVIRRLVGNRVETDPARLGSMTLAMLQAERSHLASPVRDFVRSVRDELQPDVVIFSNLLMAGSAPLLKEQLGIPILATLQGDDLFLAGLLPAIQVSAQAELKRIAASIDRFLVHSRSYLQHVADMLGLSAELFSVIPLGIESPESYAGEALPNPPATGPATLGYLARLAPEKGLHLLCEAFVRLKAQPATADCRLRIAGWHGPRQRAYLRESIEPIRKAGWLHDVDLVGEVDGGQKRTFLRSLDVLSVPSPYAEPKGLYVLESLAAGVPVVQPNHGAFPELMASTGGGLLFEPNRFEHLVEQLTALLADRPAARRLGAVGRAGVVARHNVTHTAGAAWTEIQAVLRTAGT